MKMLSGKINLNKNYWHSYKFKMKSLISTMTKALVHDVRKRDYE